MVQRSESRAKEDWAIPSKQAILRQSLIMAQRSADNHPHYEQRPNAQSPITVTAVAVYCHRGD